MTSSIIIDTKANTASYSAMQIASCLFEHGYRTRVVNDTVKIINDGCTANALEELVEICQLELIEGIVIKMEIGL